MAKKNIRHFSDPRVADVFAALPIKIRDPLLEIRSLIFATAAADARIGELTETLKWNEPAYLTEATGSGSTIRINRRKGESGDYALYFNCQTTLVAGFRKKFPQVFRFEKNRALILSAGKKIPRQELAECIRTALLYHNKPSRQT